MRFSSRLCLKLAYAPTSAKTPFYFGDGTDYPAFREDPVEEFVALRLGLSRRLWSTYVMDGTCVRRHGLRG